MRPPRDKRVGRLATLMLATFDATRQAQRYAANMTAEEIRLAKIRALDADIALLQTGAA